MFKMTVTEESIKTKSGVSTRTGKSYAIHEQRCVVELPNGERRAITVEHDLPEGPALKAGTYVPGDDAGYVGDFGSLRVSTRAKHWRLESAAKPAQRAAA